MHFGRPSVLHTQRGSARWGRIRVRTTYAERSWPHEQDIEGHAVRLHPAVGVGIGVGVRGGGGVGRGVLGSAIGARLCGSVSARIGIGQQSRTGFGARVERVVCWRARIAIKEVHRNGVAARGGRERCGGERDERTTPAAFPRCRRWNLGGFVAAAIRTSALEVHMAITMGAKSEHRAYYGLGQGSLESESSRIRNTSNGARPFALSNLLPCTNTSSHVSAAMGHPEVHWKRLAICASDGGNSEMRKISLDRTGQFVAPSGDFFGAGRRCPAVRPHNMRGRSIQ